MEEALAVVRPHCEALQTQLKAAISKCASSTTADDDDDDDDDHLTAEEVLERQDLSPEDLDEIAQTTNMKRGHLLRVQCWLKGLVVCTGEDEFVVVHRYAGHFLKSVGEKTAAAQAAAEKKG